MSAAILFSTGGAAIKGTDLNAWQVAGLRSLVACASIVLLLPGARREWHWKNMPVALAYGATLILFVSATKLTTAANAIFLQDTAPLFVLLLAPLLLRERIRRADLGFMFAVGIGLALFFAAGESATGTAPNPRMGNLLGLMSALTWGLTIIGLRWITRGSDGNSGMSTVALGNIFAAATALPFALPIARFDATDAAVILWLGIFQIGLAYVCLTRGIRSVPALEATTILLLEPALNPIWAWLVHGEVPAALSLAGGAIIVIATFWRAASDAGLSRD